MAALVQRGRGRLQRRRQDDHGQRRDAPRARVLEAGRRPGDDARRGPHAGRQRRAERGPGLDAARAAGQSRRSPRSCTSRATSRSRSSPARTCTWPTSPPRQAVELIRRARERGIHVTAEVAPHHLTLTDEAALGYDTNTKVAPPLRSADDRDACRAGLVDGTLDAIATDHAPHAQHEKELDFTEAPPGMIGFETAAAVTLELVRDGRALAARVGAAALDESGAHPVAAGRQPRASARWPT